MSNYIIMYLGGARPESPEAAAEQKAKWQAWVEGLGDAAVDPGTPLGKSKIVSTSGVSDNDGSNPVSGYSVVKADSLEAAVEIAQDCPFLDTGGTLEVAQMIQLS